MMHGKKNISKFVVYVPPMCFGLYKVIIREVYTKAYKYSEFCRSFAYMVGP